MIQQVKRLALRSNQELASEFVDVVKLFDEARVFPTGQLARSISACPIPIHEYFREHSTLKALGVAGIGELTKAILENILLFGVAGARRHYKDNLIERLTTPQVTAFSPSEVLFPSDGYRSGDMTQETIDPGWENLIRSIEDFN